MITIKQILPLAFSGLLAVTMIAPEMEAEISVVSESSLTSGSGEMIAQAPVGGERRRVRRRTRRRVKRRHERREEMKGGFISVTGNFYWKSDMA